MNKPQDANAYDDKPWYRSGYVWLVLSGPIVVVIASFVTAWIAWHGQDPIVEEDYYQKGIALSQKKDLVPLMPAQRARNHSATPTEHVPIQVPTTAKPTSPKAPSP